MSNAFEYIAASSLMFLKIELKVAKQYDDFVCMADQRLASRLMASHPLNMVAVNPRETPGQYLALT
jgi:hypothetical protein